MINPSLVNGHVISMTKLDKITPITIPVSNINNEFISTDIYSYSLNSNGFRSPEFSNDMEVIFGGCSNTFGAGMPQEATWPSLVAEGLGITNYGVVAVPGYSIQAIVSDIFSVIREYSKPKMIICNFPDFSRHDFVRLGQSGAGQFNIKKEVPNIPVRVGVINARYNDGCVIPDHFCSFLNLMAIMHLESFCKEAGVKFLWTSWHIRPDLQVENPGNYSNLPEFVNNPERLLLSSWFKEHFSGFLYDEYISIPEDEFQQIRFSSKGVELSGKKPATPTCCFDIYDKFRGCFYYAYDRYLVPRKYQSFESQSLMTSEELAQAKIDYLCLDKLPAHPGAHSHWHWAKLFLDNL